MRALAVTGAAAWPERPQDAPAAEPGTPPRFLAADLRRASRLCRLALAPVETALGEAGLIGREDIGLIVGTGLGNLDDAAAFLEESHATGTGSPLRFQRSLVSSLASEIAILYRLRGCSLTATVGLHSGEAALLLAALAIASRRCEACLCVAADADSPPLRRALADLGRREPPGEGAAAIVVESLDHAAARGARVLARLDHAAIRSFADRAAAGAHGSAGLLRVVWAIRSPSIAPPPGIEIHR